MLECASVCGARAVLEAAYGVGKHGHTLRIHLLHLLRTGDAADIILRPAFSGTTVIDSSSDGDGSISSDSFVKAHRFDPPPP